MKRPTPLATFRVFPEPKSRLFYRVVVFRNAVDLRIYLSKDQRQPGRFCKGMVSPWTRRHYTKHGAWTSPELGRIALAKTWLGGGLLAHESTHAALAWARRIGLRVDDVPMATEERFCYGLGEIMRGILNGLHRKGLVT